MPGDQYRVVEIQHNPISVAAIVVLVREIAAGPVFGGDRTNAQCANAILIAPAYHHPTVKLHHSFAALVAAGGVHVHDADFAVAVLLETCDFHYRVERVALSWMVRPQTHLCLSALPRQ